MNKLRIRAGAEAFKRIKQEGFNADMISGVVAAAGGPKWFTTYGLMKYIIADLTADSKNHLHFLGSSVGSWQMAAALTSSPARSIDALQKAYSTTLYTGEPNAHEISMACKSFIESTIDGEVEHILNHKKRSLHIIATRGKGLLSHSNTTLRGLGFGGTFLLNMLNRRFLSIGGQRVIFGNHTRLPYEPSKDILSTTQVLLNTSNLVPALRASGSIPFVMEGVSMIDQAPQGTYWDGGMTDYHVSLPFNVKGLILHPHFLPDVLLGWYDKKLPIKRRASKSFMSKVILITPTSHFVNSLPRRQISDMKDFYHFGQDQNARVEYWTEISKRSLELGREFKDLVDSNSLASVIEEY